MDVSCLCTYPFFMMSAQIVTGRVLSMFMNLSKLQTPLFKRALSKSLIQYAVSTSLPIALLISSKISFTESKL
jgi:hypothetical protein